MDTMLTVIASTSTQSQEQTAFNIVIVALLVILFCMAAWFAWQGRAR